MLLGRFFFSRMSLSKSESAVEVNQICSSCLLEAYLQNQIILSHHLATLDASEIWQRPLRAYCRIQLQIAL